MYFPERKVIAVSLQLHEANDSIGKGLHALGQKIGKILTLNGAVFKELSLYLRLPVVVQLVHGVAAVTEGGD